MNKNKHLTLEERHVIEHSLNNQLSFKAIAALVEKDCTTISKEVKAHLVFEHKGAFHMCFNDCANRRKCDKYGSLCVDCKRDNKRNKCSFCGKCIDLCADYIKEICPLLLKSPYVCNGCSIKYSCTLEKRYYRAYKAQEEYELIRSESRSGFNLSEAELKHLDSVISPLLKNGQSIHHILINNQDKISCCEKTAYIYADNGLFSAINLDMPRKVRFRKRKKKSIPLKVDKTCRIGRTYDDYKAYRESHPALRIAELDTVEGVKGGAVLLTIHFVLPKLQLAFFRESNDSQSVTKIFNRLYSILGYDNFSKLFGICLADNGSEFSNPFAIETDEDGVIRTLLFYCDPSSPGQKGYGKIFIM